MVEALLDDATGTDADCTPPRLSDCILDILSLEDSKRVLPTATIGAGILMPVAEYPARIHRRRFASNLTLVLALPKPALFLARAVIDTVCQFVVTFRTMHDLCVRLIVQVLLPTFTSVLDTGVAAV
jgi:hypothetical protein